MDDDRRTRTPGGSGATGGSSESTRWLVALVVLVIALAVLLPLAVGAMRDLVALTG